MIKIDNQMINTINKMIMKTCRGPISDHVGEFNAAPAISCSDELCHRDEPSKPKNPKP